LGVFQQIVGETRIYTVAGWQKVTPFSQKLGQLPSDRAFPTVSVSASYDFRSTLPAGRKGKGDSNNDIYHGATLGAMTASGVPTLAPQVVPRSTKDRMATIAMTWLLIRANPAHAEERASQSSSWPDPRRCP
jgi:hypothetical protein